MSMTTVWLLCSYLRFLIYEYEDRSLCHIGDVKLSAEAIDSKDVLIRQ